MYKNLMAEVEYIQEARGYGILEAIMFINEYEAEFPSEVRRELRDFMAEGARMFAPRDEYELVSSDGTVIDTFTMEAV